MDKDRTAEAVHWETGKRDKSRQTGDSCKRFKQDNPKITSEEGKIT